MKIYSKTITAGAGFGLFGGDTQSGMRPRIMPMFQADGGDGDGDGDGESNGNEPSGEPDKPVKPTVKPTDEAARLLKEVMTLKNKLKAEADAKAALAAQFEGIDPEQVRVLLAERVKAEEDRMRAAGDFDALKKRMAEENQREITKILAERDTVKAEAEKLSSVIKELTIGSAFAGSKFLADETVLTSNKARRVYEDHFDVEDGQVVAYDAPRGAASRTPLVDGRGVPLPFDEAMRRIVEVDPDRDHLLRAKTKSGSGVTNSPNLRAPTTPSDETLSGVDRIAAALSRGGLTKAK